jgi:hypothetical protein
MMKRNFVYLLIVTLLAVVAVVLFAPGDKTSGRQSGNTLLLPSIAEQVNEVERVEIVAAGSAVIATLLKTSDGWRFEQMDGYQADWPKLQKLLADLATARVVEAKTDKPEYYARLGVEDISGEDAGGMLVSLSVGGEATGIIIGNRAQGRQGRYARLQNEKASVLVDRDFEVSAVPLEWANSEIVDISSSEVAEVEIIHPTGENLLITRVSADQTDFEFVGLPTGREINSSWSVNSLASVFSMLKMDSVRSENTLDWSAAVKMRLLLFSGVEIMADVLEVDGEHLFRLQASHPAANVIKDQAEDDSHGSPEQQEIDQRAADDVARIVKDINQRTAGWIYVIPKHKYDAMVKKTEDLLKPLEST